MGKTKTTAPALPDCTAIVAAELGGLGEYGRVTLTLDFCGGTMARYTVTRERSVKTPGGENRGD